MNIKNTLKFSVLVFSIVINGCTSTSVNTIVSDLSFQELQNSSIKLLDISIDDQHLTGKISKEEAEKIISNELKKQWPIISSDGLKDNAANIYTMDIILSRYSVSHFESEDSSTSYENRDIAVTKVYTTSTSIDKIVTIYDSDDNVVWLQNTPSKVNDENRTNQGCSSGAFIDQLACNLLFSSVASSDYYPDPIPADKMLKLVASDISLALPSPSCKTDGFTTCLGYLMKKVF